MRVSDHRTSRVFSAFGSAGIAILFSLSTFVSAIAAGPNSRFDYLDMLRLTREVMTRKPARALLNEMFKEELIVNPELAEKYGFTAGSIKGFTETQMMTLLQEIPEVREEVRQYLAEIPANATTTEDAPALEKLRASWRERFKTLFHDRALLERFIQKNNPLEPFLMENAPGAAGYGQIRTYVTHPYYADGVLRPADDAEQAIVDFIDGAGRELRFNVFDFDSEAIANAFIRARKRGVDVAGGIDKGVIENRPEVKLIFDRLNAAGVPVEAVDSVALNHQKLITADWSVPGKGKTVASEGNFTKSCLSPGGDLSGSSLESRFSKPNANMVNIIESDSLAMVVHHNLTYSVEFKLRGEDFPISGSFKIPGAPGPGGKARSITIAFTPNGAWDDVNQNIIGRIIKTVPGPIRMSQFAASSKEVEEALLQHAIAERNAGRRFVLHAVGDTPFAMQYWSIFLSMSGYTVDTTGPVRKYVKMRATENRWLRALGKAEYEEFLSRIRLAPSAYGRHWVETPNGKVEVTAKAHHKLFVIGEPPNEVGIFGSFNSSEGAEKNTEYIIIVEDEELTGKMNGIVRYLSENSPRPVWAEALRRNKLKDFLPILDAEIDANKAGKPGTISMSRKQLAVCHDLLKEVETIVKRRQR